MLPAFAGLFDLVVIDEAAAVALDATVPSLLRARRAMVVGDPRQLRHRSFVPRDRIEQVLATHGLSGDASTASLLDVNRNSIYDVAATRAPPIMLDLHFRSIPPLVEPVLERLYDGSVAVTTRTPATESERCVVVDRVDGREDDSGVNEAEVDRVLWWLAELRGAGASSVAVIAPLRAQADALERRILDTMDLADVQALDLRVGTVHAMAGNEREVVVLSLALDERATAARWRFVEDPSLAAVMLTRARRRMVVVHSAAPPVGGLLERYLDAQVERDGNDRREAGQAVRPLPASTHEPPDPWLATVREALVASGLEVREAYLVGRHRLDLVVGGADGFVGVVCHVHPDGPEAHVDRHLDLLGWGWRLLEAHELQVGGDLPGFCGQVAEELERQRAEARVRRASASPSSSSSGRQLAQSARTHPLERTWVVQDGDEGDVDDGGAREDGDG